MDRATSKDPMDALAFLVETGFAVGIRGVYRGSAVQMRAVKDERQALVEDRDIGKALLRLRDEARVLLHAKRGGKSDA